MAPPSPNHLHRPRLSLERAPSSYPPPPPPASRSPPRPPPTGTAACIAAPSDATIKSSLITRHPVPVAPPRLHAANPCRPSRRAACRPTSPLRRHRFRRSCPLARATDIFLVTFPKSGTTWIKALLYSALHRRADELLAHSPHQLISFLESQVFVKDRIPDLSSLPEPWLLMTHIPSQSLPDSVAASGCKVVYLFRDPKDCFVSLWHFWNRFMPWNIDDAHQQFCNGVSLFGLYWEHVLSYWNWHVERPSEVLFLTYEELAADTLGHLRRLTEFVGRPFTTEEQDARVDRKIVEICAMESLSGLEVNRSGMTNFTKKDVPNNISFRRGVVGDWRNHLTPEMARRIDEITEVKFKGSGLLLHPPFLQVKRELNEL
uniref:Sulfotransferase n=1 Tax=Oryza nivara TaxID=4536 RepID=A0A0E0J6F4_ORYNI